MLAFVFLKNEDMNEASSVLNFARSIGGSFGISFVIDTLVTRREAFHRDVLISHISQSSIIFNDIFNHLRQYLVTRGFSFTDTYKTGIALVNNTLNIQSATMSYQDAFHIMMWISLVFLVLLPFIKRLKNKSKTVVCKQTKTIE